MRLVGFILRHKLVAMGIFVLLVLLLNYLFVTVPNAQAAAFKSRMSPGIASVKQLFKQVADSADSPLFNDPDISLEEKIRLLVATANLNHQTLLALEHLKADASELGRPVIAPTGDYNDASRMQQKLLPVIAQSQDVVGEYSRMVDFLLRYYDVQSRISPVIAGNSLISANARVQLQHEAMQLGEMPVPADLKIIQAKTTKLLNEIASPNASDAVDSLNSDLFVLIGGKSVTVDNIKELPEKLESNNL